MVAQPEVVDQAGSERKLHIDALLQLEVVFVGDVVVDKIGGDQYLLTDSGGTHADIKHRGVNTLGVVVSLDDVDGTEQEIHVQVVIHERGVIVSVGIGI